MVFVADGNEYKKKEVALGLKSDDRVEIVSGLAVGDKVVVKLRGVFGVLIVRRDESSNLYDLAKSDASNDPIERAYLNRKDAATKSN